MAKHMSGFVPDPDAVKLADLYARAGNYSNPAICVTDDDDDIHLQEHVPGESIPLRELVCGQDSPNRPSYILKGWKRGPRWDLHVINEPLISDKTRVEDAKIVALNADGSYYSWPYRVDAAGNIWE